MTDHILLPRSALTEEMERNGDLARLLIYLLRKADENGEINTDMAAIATDLRLSRQSVRTLMKKIETNQILTKSSTTRTTKLKLEYQDNKPKRQPRRQPNQQPNTNQIASTKFTPPTDAEVAAYVTEKGYHFNPELFVPFYQSKGWMVGKNPMKDWKASCRTWELEWKKKHGERFYYEIQPAVPADTAATRAQSRDRLRSLATGVVSRSADKLLNLYNGVGQNPDDSAD